MTDTQPRGIPRSTVQTSEGTLTCQWCSVALPASETICPTCGSPGIPDESMVVPGIDEGEIEPQAAEPEEELVEWWNEDAAGQDRIHAGAEDGEMMPMILGLAGTGIVCVLLGAFVAPILLASVFENSLGVAVEDSADLRPLGAILGLLVAAFVGAIGVWITAPRR